MWLPQTGHLHCSAQRFVIILFGCCGADFNPIMHIVTAQAGFTKVFFAVITKKWWGNTSGKSGIPQALPYTSGKCYWEILLPEANTARLSPQTQSRVPHRPIAYETRHFMNETAQLHHKLHHKHRVMQEWRVKTRQDSVKPHSTPWISERRLTLISALEQYNTCSC